MKYLQKGFTLIELLIVIAVLGVLAVAVLSAINPIEQINRGKDTGTRSDAEQVLNAIDRFYTGAGYYPWMTTADPNAAGYVLPTIDPSENIAGAVGLGSIVAIDVLAGTGASVGGTAEIKSAFANRLKGTGYNPLYIYNGYNATNESNAATYLCFQPASNQFMNEARTRCCERDSAGALTIPTDFPTEACVDVTCGTPSTGTARSCLP